MNVGFLFTYTGTATMMGGVEIARQGKFIEGSSLVWIGLSLLIARGKLLD